jgi:hypothetical protein
MGRKTTLRTIQKIPKIGKSCETTNVLENIEFDTVEDIEVDIVVDTDCLVVGTAADTVVDTTFSVVNNTLMISKLILCL